MTISPGDIARMLTTCGECRKTVVYGETKIVSRPTPRKPGAKVYYGMTTTQEMRVCNTHPDTGLTGWPNAS